MDKAATHAARSGDLAVALRKQGYTDHQISALQFLDAVPCAPDQSDHAITGSGFVVRTWVDWDVIFVGRLKVKWQEARSLNVLYIKGGRS